MAEFHLASHPFRSQQIVEQDSPLTVGREQLLFIGRTGQAWFRGKSV